MICVKHQNPEYNGVAFGLGFKEGVAHTNNAPLARRLLAMGYDVQDVRTEVDRRAPAPDATSEPVHSTEGTPKKK